MESVRWRPLALISSRSRKTASKVSSSNRSTFPSTRRERNSLRTVWSKPGSVSDRPKAYFQSIRPRTASAA